jgi:hypothetical protein
VTAAASLSPVFADKLVKVLGMLGSDHDGEVAAAGRTAHSMLKAKSLTWSDVIVPAVPVPQQQSRAPRRWRRATSPSDTAALCLQWRDEVLTDWEADFCRSIVGRRRVSTKQAGVLARIVGKVEAFARATGEWA